MPSIPPTPLEEAHQGGFHLSIPPRAFTKPALSSAALVGLLQSRGLTISNRADADRALKFIGYYRLSGYMLPFQKGGSGADRHDFATGTDFDDVLRVYAFDRQLRLLAMDALERIEIAFRTAATDVIAGASGPFWFNDPTSFHRGFNHSKFIFNIEEKIGVRDASKRTVSIGHYLTTYSNPPLPPSWMVLEALPFGSVAYLIRGLRTDLRSRVGRTLGIGEPILHSWVLSLSYARNLCAHHQRFWNRHFTIKPQVAASYTADLTPNTTAYAQLVSMRVLMRTISPASQWHQRLKLLIASHPNIDVQNMGFAPGWERRPLWL
jgi:abortive infection bacteriophage resistance protein